MKEEVKTMAEKQGKQWSARSQPSYLEEQRLRKQLSNCGSGIAASERKVKELERVKEKQLNRKFGQQEDFSIQGLSLTVEELEGERRCLSAFQEHRASLEAQIAELVNLDPARLEARTEQQSRFVAMATERLALDRKIDGAVAALRAMLQERAKLTGRMAEACSPIELDFNDSETGRFEALAAALPDSLAEGSETWTARQLGQSRRTKPYIVRDDCLVVPETLAHSGVYFFGETIPLTDAEAAELLRVDRPDATVWEPWRRITPSVSTLEAHEAATAEAEKRGISVKQVYFWEDYERDRATREQYGKERGNVPLPPPANPSFRSLRPGRGDTVRLTAKGNIGANGRDYHAGDTLEVPAEDAWSLLRAGAAERAD